MQPRVGQSTRSRWVMPQARLPGRELAGLSPPSCGRTVWRSGAGSRCHKWADLSFSGAWLPRGSALARGTENVPQTGRVPLWALSVLGLEGAEHRRRSSFPAKKAASSPNTKATLSCAIFSVSSAHCARCGSKTPRCPKEAPSSDLPKPWETAAKRSGEFKPPLSSLMGSVTCGQCLCTCAETRASAFQVMRLARKCRGP